MAKIVHKLIARTAKAISAEAWEILSSNDDFHRAWPKVRPFVANQWRNFVGHARASLVVMLQPIPGSEKEPDGPRYVNSQHVRDEIYEALCTEGAFKARPVVPASPHLLH